jgi:hypothetical protein
MTIMITGGAGYIGSHTCVTTCFVSSHFQSEIRAVDPGASLWPRIACIYSASCYLDCLIIVGQS